MRNTIETDYNSDASSEVAPGVSELAELPDFNTMLEQREAEKNSAERLRFGRIGRKVLDAVRGMFGRSGGEAPNAVGELGVAENPDFSGLEGESFVEDEESAKARRRDERLDSIVEDFDDLISREQLEEITRQAFGIGQSEGVEAYTEFVKTRGAEILREPDGHVSEGRLWTLGNVVRRLNNIEHFGEYGEHDPEQKFYCSMDIETAKRLLATGVYDVDDTPPMPMPGQTAEELGDWKPEWIVLSHDERDAEGRIQSGFGKERAGSSREVTFVLSPDVIDLADFDGSTNPPVANHIRLKQCLLGVVAQDPGRVRELFDSMTGLDERVPVFGNFEEWQDGSMYPPQMLTEWKHGLDANQEYYYQQGLKEQCFEKVDVEQADARIAEFLERFDRKELRKIAGIYRKAERWNKRLSDEERAERWNRAEQQVCNYISEKLGLDPVPAFQVIDDEETKWDGCFLGKSIAMEVNRAKLQVGDMLKSFDVIAHELWHGYQRQRERERRPDRTDVLAEYYHYNFEHYLDGTVAQCSYASYRGQLIEYEAWTFGDAMRDKMKAYLGMDKQEETSGEVE